MASLALRVGLGQVHFAIVSFRQHRGEFREFVNANRCRNAFLLCAASAVFRAGFVDTLPDAREPRVIQKADKEIAMPTNAPKILCDLCNNLVWVVFVFLGYRALLILVESPKRARNLRQLAREVRGLCLLVSEILRAKTKDSGLTLKECRAGVLTELHRLWGEISNSELATFMRGLCESIVAGRAEEAKDRVERLLSERDGRNSTESLWKDRCTALGCLGTCLGIFGGFALSDGKTPPLNDLGFALGTTALGLVLSAIIEWSLATVFESAWCDLRDELENARMQLSQVWNERTQMLPNDSGELAEISRVAKEVRELRHCFSDLSFALREVFREAATSNGQGAGGVCGLNGTDV